MKKLIYIFMTALAMVFTQSAAWASFLPNNIALSSLGAQAFDNGNWVEQVSVPGFEYDAELAIDDSVSGFTYWAGLGSLPQQQMWVLFDQTYSINKIYIEEWDIAYMNTGTLEYLNGGSWLSLASINKASPDLLLSFSPVVADGIRLTVFTSTQPSGWINKAAAVYSLEASTVPIPASAGLMILGVTAMIAFKGMRRISAS